MSVMEHFVIPFDRSPRTSSTQFQVDVEDLDIYLKLCAERHSLKRPHLPTYLALSVSTETK